MAFAGQEGCKRNVQNQKDKIRVGGHVRADPSNSRCRNRVQKALFIEEGVDSKVNTVESSRSACIDVWICSCSTTTPTMGLDLDEL